MNSRIVPLLMSIALVAACGRRESAPATPETSPVIQSPSKHVLKTYQVPAGHETALKRLLQGNSYPIQVISDNGAQTQFVRLNPQFTGSGYFVLSAPEGIHDGVRGLLDVVTKQDLKATQPLVKVTYWLVLGWPSDKTEIGPQLEAISEPLGELTSLGTMRFELLESLNITALDGEEGIARGRLATTKHTGFVENGKIELRLEIQVRGKGPDALIETVLSIKPDQYAVLGQAGYTPDSTPIERMGNAGPTLFYLAHAEIQK